MSNVQSSWTALLKAREWYCAGCEGAGVDTTGGVWFVEDVEEYTEVRELWSESGLMLPVRCPLHLKEMQVNEERRDV